MEPRVGTHKIPLTTLRNKGGCYQSRAFRPVVRIARESCLRIKFHGASACIPNRFLGVAPTFMKAVANSVKCNDVTRSQSRCDSATAVFALSRVAIKCHKLAYKLATSRPQMFARFSSCMLLSVLIYLLQ